MRIISKTNDYYDSIQAYGQDQSLNYVRKEEQISLKEALDYLGVSADGSQLRHSFATPFLKRLGYELPDFFNRSLPFRKALWNDKLDVDRFLIGFCGHWYPCLRIKRSYLRIPGKGTFSLSDADEQRKPRHIFAGYEDKIEEFRDCYSEKGFSNRMKAWRDFLNLDIKPSDELFHDFKSPILVADVTDYGRETVRFDETVLTKDANLSEFGFGRVRDPFMAYQDIAQYLSGVLGVGTPEPVQISDEHMRDAKGFHGMSFRKRPSGK